MIAVLIVDRMNIVLWRVKWQSVLRAHISAIAAHIAGCVLPQDDRELRKSKALEILKRHELEEPMVSWSVPPNSSKLQIVGHEDSGFARNAQARVI